MAHLFDFLPLIFLTILVSIFAWVGYQMYLYSQTLAHRGKQSMAKHNITVGKDGARIGVKEVRSEDYSGKTQDYLVRAWNLSSWPEYRSRFWNKQAQPQKTAPG